MSFDLDSFLKEARQKAVSGKLPPTWKPQNPGDELYGVIVDAIPNPWDESTISYIVRTPSGEEYMTPRNQVLTSLLGRMNPEVGDLIYIRYEGVGKQKPGRNPPKIFAVYVKKKTGQPDVQPAAPPPAQPSQQPEELPPVETAEQVERTEEKKEAPDPEVVKKYVLTLPNIYGDHIVRTKFESLLRAKGWNLTAEEVAMMIPEVVELTKYGVKIKGAEQK